MVRAEILREKEKKKGLPPESRTDSKGAESLLRCPPERAVTYEFPPRNREDPFREC
jgi:hypothetical protein